MSYMYVHRYILEWNSLRMDEKPGHVVNIANWNGMVWNG